MTVSKSALRLSALLTLAALALAAAYPASAHGAPSPGSAWTRLLADYSDDCGGDGLTNLCHGSDDLIALDVREAHDGTLGDVAIFRFWLDHGDAGTNKQTLKLTGPGGAKSFDLSGAGSSYSGTFDRVGPATGTGDGTRFYVDATAKLSSLGASVGGALNGFSIQAYHGTTAGDKMPGTYSGVGGDGPAPGADSACGCPYQRQSYTVRGASYYVSLSADPGSANVAQGHELLVMLNTKNGLNDQAQTVHFTIAGAGGVEARFHSDASGSYSPELDVHLDAGQQGAVHLAVTGKDAGAQGTLTITATSDQGGLTTVQVPYKVGAAGSTPSNSQATGSPGGPSTHPTASTPAGTSKKKADGPGTGLAALALAATALAAVAMQRRTR